jgi:hypothetical protein
MNNTDDIDEFYPMMNQVEATNIEVLEKPKRIRIEFDTNTLNFAHYDFRANDEKKLLKTQRGQIEELLQEGVNTIEIIAVNKLGECSRPCIIKIIVSGNVHYFLKFDNGKIKERNPSFWMFAMDSTERADEDWLRQEISSIIMNLTNDLDKYIAIREWVIDQATKTDAHLLIKGGDSPGTIIKKLRQGDGALCGIIAKAYVGAVNSVGLTVREVALWRYYPLVKGLVPNGHNVTEVWVKELNKWALMDPTYNLYFTIDGIPASTLDMHKALASGIKKVKPVQSGDLTWLYDKEYTQNEIIERVRKGTNMGIVSESLSESLRVDTTDYTSYLSYFKHIFLPIDSRHWKTWSNDELPQSMTLALSLANFSNKFFFVGSYFAKQFQQLYNHLTLLYIRPQYLHWVDESSPPVADPRRTLLIASFWIHTITFVLWATLIVILAYLLIKKAIHLFSKKVQFVKS